MAEPRSVAVYESSSALEKALTDLLRTSADDAISKRGKFMVGVSGGGMIKQLSAAIPAVYAKKEEVWEKWHIFFCDERVVPFEDKASTFGAYKEDLLKKVPDLEKQFEIIDSSKDAKDNAKLYHNKLVHYFGNSMWPVFDLLLLGVGPDGHTCSLFPDHPLLKESGKDWVVHLTDSPKPPPVRITLTLGVLNHAKHAVFVTTGSGKKDALKHIFEEGNAKKLPAGLVQPQQNGGKLTWILDKDAAAGVKVDGVESSKLAGEL